MSKWLMAICDSDESYMYNFVEFVQEHKKGLFEIKAFSSTQGVEEYLKENTVDILVVSEKNTTEDIKNPKINMSIILSDGDLEENIYDCPRINKFQSADNVIREIMECCRGTEKQLEIGASVLNKQTRIIGIYSPLNRCYKTTLAVVMGMFYAKSKKVLYMNLEEFSGFGEFINLFNSKDLSDLMYFYKQNPENLLSKLYSSTNKLSGLDFINPIVFSKAIRNLETKEWTEFISFISEKSDYEILILDLSNMLEDVFTVLEICDEIYMPVLQDYISVSKVSEFESYLQLIGMEKILEKVKKLNLPSVKETAKGEKYFEGLLRGEFGSYVEKYVE